MPSNNPDGYRSGPSPSRKIKAPSTHRRRASTTQNLMTRLNNRKKKVTKKKM